MFARFARGRGIARAGWSILKLHPKLLLLPILSGVAFLALLVAIALSVFAGLATQGPDQIIDTVAGVRFDEPVVYALLFAFYFVCSAIAIFFNAALVFCALEAFAGRTPSLSGGLGTALGR